ncbi:hypothetical protein E1A91_D11G020100v1 [Gossypium mustelinum]|uniref:Uncharacterized protein n=1 Tax=Gossypium mustelinum TaxID=34275 RepID=A0A5D2SM73_GOSMU|nr:hypothetical protein E1A91_D11G020100v1 [Gossypium mustelinum]
MGNYFEEEEDDDQFFDSRSVYSDECCSSPDFGQVNGFSDNFDQYKFWSVFPESVDKRRHRLWTWMGLSFVRSSFTGEDPGGPCRDALEVSQDSEVALSTLALKDGVLSNQSNDGQEPVEMFSMPNHFTHQDKNLDDQMELVVIEKSCSSKSVSSLEFKTSPMPSSPQLDPQLRGKLEGRPRIDPQMKVKKSWLSKLGAIAHVVDRHVEVGSKQSDYDSVLGERTKRVRVHPCNKHSKELSSLYCGQEFLAHKGSISTMKFSLDGKFLATAGEDCIVRIWKIIEDENLDGFNIQDLDSSCLYFRMNHLSQLTPLNMDKDHIDKIKKLGRLSDSTCVIFPPKVFRISEKPLHEFQGHSGEILALSWSKKGFLLSSSVDKTVRLWQVGSDRCLRVFSHNNYVTSVAFNPMDDNYFISGSIDGKVRIWEVLHCRVIDYTDVRDIVTAVCYRPDGKGGIVGSMTGNCRFYDIIGNRLQIDVPVYLQSKKKLPGKKITGFEFSPCDPSKVIITSADSLVQVLSGRDVVYKLKAPGFRIATSQISATFSQDGKQIISASEDSNVYIWNYTNPEKNCSKAKNISSRESFLSHNASIAIPWCGIKTDPGTLMSSESNDNMRENSLTNGKKQLNPKVELEQLAPLASPNGFSLKRVLMESLTRGSATWPEETLPNTSPAAIASDLWKFELKVLKSAYQSMLSSHKWGLVIVTASFDGRIRTYLNYGLPIRV